MFIIGRHINGITLNPLEYVLDDSGDVMKFDTMASAHVFLLEHGVSENELECFTFEEVAV